MFSLTQARVKTLPGMHCDHVLGMFLELVTRLFKHNNGQQVVINCIIDL